MVRLHEESRRLGEGRVLCQNPRIDVPVRRDEGQAARFVVQRARDPPNRGIGIEEAILGEDAFDDLGGALALQELRLVELGELEQRVDTLGSAEGDFDLAF